MNLLKMLHHLFIFLNDLIRIITFQSVTEILDLLKGKFSSSFEKFSKIFSSYLFILAFKVYFDQIKPFISEDFGSLKFVFIIYWVKVFKLKIHLKSFLQIYFLLSWSFKNIHFFIVRSINRGI